MNAPNPYSPPAAGVAASPSAMGAAAAQDPYAAAGGVATVSFQAIDLLRQTRPWVMLMSVVLFLGSGFMVLGGASMILLGLFAPRGATGSGPVSPAVLGFVYLPLAVLYIYPALKLWQYASAIGRLLTSRSPVELEAALGHQKSFWKFSGITTIAVIVLYIVGIIGAVIFGVLAATHGTHV